MINEILNILQQRCEIRAKNLLLVGLSGGPDSLCLLHVLWQAGYPLRAVHVNHRLRAEADAEARIVMDFSHHLGIDCVSSTVDARDYAQSHAISIEEAARILRYRTLFEQAQAANATAVAVGHTADDQVETILMHLLRGTGLVGLRGMEFRVLPNPWSADIPLVRPLLSSWRMEIQQYNVENGLQPITDRSNLDKSFLRNRVRHELLPQLEGYNPSIREALLRMGQSLKDDYALLQEMTDKAWQASLVRQQGDSISFRTSAVMQLPVSIQRYLLRKAIAYHLPGLRDVGFDCIERGLALVAGEAANTQTDLLAGLRLVREGKYFHVVKGQVERYIGHYPSVKPGEVQMISVPASIDLEHGWQLQVMEAVNPVSIDFQSSSIHDPYQAWLDVSDVDLPVMLRARRPGDRIRLLGMEGQATKISDLMINLKLPQQARATWPLICSAQEVLWVPGYRVSQHARIRPETKKALHLRLICRQTA